MLELPLLPEGICGYWPWKNLSNTSSEGLRIDDCPKISIVTPSFNQSQFLEEAIRSVLLQGYPNLEYFVFDGGSDDGSVEIIEKYEPWITYWESGPDAGQSNAINKGWKMATGDILAWLNSDDMYFPKALFHVGQTYLENPQSLVIIGSCEVRPSKNKTKITATDFDMRSDVLVRGGDIPGQPSVFISRGAFEAVGELREDLHYAMDWEYWLRLSMKFPENQFTLIDTTLSVFRKWSGGKIVSGLGNDLVEKRKVYKELFETSPPSTFSPSVRRNAIANTYWRQSRVFLEAKSMRRAASSFLHAFVRYPRKYNPISYLLNNADLMFPS